MFFTNLSYLRSFFHPKQLCNDLIKKNLETIVDCTSHQCVPKGGLEDAAADAWLGNTD